MNPSLLIVFLVASSNDPAATSSAAQAYAAQERIGERLDAYYRVSFDEQERHKLGMLATATQVFAERRIVLRWEFP
jgi:hypothetical protein